jgi:enediyne biosynthesis protein E3
MTYRPAVVTPPLSPVGEYRKPAGLRARIRSALFGIAPTEATFARRGFMSENVAVRERLERVGFTFLEGYHAALETEGSEELAHRLNAPEPVLRGFAFEGAAMALGLLDALTPWQRDRVTAFVRGAGAAHAYMVHVGAGWALARLRRPFNDIPHGMDPLLGWLAADGYGFHQGYFHPRRFVHERAVPARVSGYGLRAFDQGLGRSLWFIFGADPVRIGKAISWFPPIRREGLWSGAGLACAYAGGVLGDEAKYLAASVGANRRALAQGAAFAAEARRRAGNPAAHTDRACRTLCGLSADDAAAVTMAAREGLTPCGSLPAYGVWRVRVQDHFASRDCA